MKALNLGIQLRQLFCKCLLLSMMLTSSASVAEAQSALWHQLNGIYNSANFHDLYFINPNTGWLIHTYGNIYRTTNGGYNWLKTDSIVLGGFTDAEFINENTGWISSRSYNLFKTTNGGANLVRITNFPNPVPGGLECIHILNDQFIYGCGRYDALANFVKSTDGGNTWTTKSLEQMATGLRDSYFFDESRGLVAGGLGSGNNREAVILYTSDSGLNWIKVYEGNRVIEAVQKICFINHLTGYASVERITYPEKFVLKTTNGGLNWVELPFPNFHEHGIGFINANTGWVGGDYNPTYGTTDGGQTWFNANIGQFIFGFQFFGDTLGFACGKYVYKYEKTNSIIQTNSETPGEFRLMQNFPNPFNPTTAIRFEIKTSGNVLLRVFDLLGREVAVLVNEYLRQGSYETVFDVIMSGGQAVSGIYLYQIVVNPSGQHNASADQISEVGFSDVKKMLLIK